MRIENVTFVDEAVKKLTLDVFLAKHMKVFWQDRSEKDRRKMLTDAYNIITGKKKGTKR